MAEHIDEYESIAINEFSPTEWTNVTVTIDPENETLEYFVNGAKKGDSIPIAKNFVAAVNGVYVGTDAVDSTRYDSVDMLTLYDRVLNPQEIAVLSESKNGSVKKANEWVHIGCGVDANKVSLYKNGIKVGEADNTHDMSALINNSAMKVGDGMGESMIDEFKIYNRKLTDNEFKIEAILPSFDSYDNEMLIDCNFDEHLKINKRVTCTQIFIAYNLEENVTGQLLKLGEEKTISKLHVTRTGTHPTVTIRDDAGDLIAATVINSGGDAPGASLGTVSIYAGSPLAEFDLTSGFAITRSYLEQHMNFIQTYVIHDDTDLNQILQRTCFNSVKNGIHGAYTVDPQISEDNHTDHPDNTSILIDTDTSISYDSADLSPYSLAESYFSAWVLLKSELFTTGQIEEAILFQKGEFVVKIVIDGGAGKVNVSLGTENFHVADVVGDKWCNYGVSVCKSAGKVGIFKQVKDEIGTFAEFDVLTLGNFSAMDNSENLVCKFSGSSSGRFSIDNYRVQLGYFEKPAAFERNALMNPAILTDSLPEAEWAHVAATRDGTTGEQVLYHNGIEVSRFKDTMLDYRDSDLSMKIGKYGDYSISTGVQIADVNVYDYVADNAQIKRLYEAEIKETETQQAVLMKKILHVDTFAEDVLVGKYKVKDSSSSKIMGTKRGSVVRVDNSLQGFSGDRDYVSFANIRTSTDDFDHSIAFQIKMDGIPTSKMDVLSFGKNRNDSTKYNSVVFSYDANGVYIDFDGKAFQTDELCLTASRYDHVIITYSGGGLELDSVSLYVNGMKKVLTKHGHGRDGVFLNFPNRSTMYLGGKYGSSGFEGCLRDVAVYVGVLGQENVDRLYTNTGLAQLYEPAYDEDEVAASNADFVVTITDPPFMQYEINGSARAQITLERGVTYEFDTSSFHPAHPFKISTLENAFDANMQKAANYSDSINIPGVSYNGTTITYAVPNDAPGTLFYHCEAHNGMGGEIVIPG